MKLRLGDIFLGTVALATLAAGLAWGVRAFLVPQPSLAAVPELVKAERFGEAQACVEAYLRADPENAPARLLLVQLLLDRPDEPDRHAKEALRQLALVRPNKYTMAAAVKQTEGRAHMALDEYDEAEAAWKASLRLDPQVADSGWGLLKAYYHQGRAREARALALALHQVEPNPHDRVQLLLELVRQDAQTPDPASLVQLFEPVVAGHPNDLRAALALGRALVLDGKIDRGIALLQKTVDAHPSDAEAWEGLLNGLDDGGQFDDLVKAVDRLPPALASDRRFAKHRGRVLQERRDWKGAIAAYREGLREDPHDQKLLYRLARALRNSGELAEAEQIDEQHRQYVAAEKETLALYNEANANKSLGSPGESNTDLYERIADVRERMGLLEEANAWRSLAGPTRADRAAGIAALRQIVAPRATAQTEAKSREPLR